MQTIYLSVERETVQKSSIVGLELFSNNTNILILLPSVLLPFKVLHDFGYE